MGFKLGDLAIQLLGKDVPEATVLHQDLAGIVAQFYPGDLSALDAEIHITAVGVVFHRAHVLASNAGIVARSNAPDKPEKVVDVHMF